MGPDTLQGDANSLDGSRYIAGGCKQLSWLFKKSIVWWNPNINVRVSGLEPCNVVMGGLGFCEGGSFIQHLHRIRSNLKLLAG
jgi:hypothetical protein